MKIQIIKKNQQAAGEFNGGEILENKPIGFPREGGHLKPYSNLFYWAHAWSDSGSTIGLHPHQGFEILSFVLKNSIEHFDTKGNEWKPLEEGGAQIIRAGNGISHSEKVNANSHMFQIWFDPDLSKTLQQKASYDDFKAADFPILNEDGIKTKVYKGEGSPLKMDAEGVEISEKTIPAGSHTFVLDESKTHSFYILNGEAKVEDKNLVQDDFFIVSEGNNLTLTLVEETKLFLISSPTKLNYKTYTEQLSSR